MKSNNTGKLGYKWLLLPLIVLIISCTILYTVVHNANIMNNEQTRTKASLNAVTYANRMVTELNGGIGITNSLEQILISEDGEVGKFDNVASDMMTDYVQSIQLAPAGIVTDIYPEAGNEAGKIDLVHDEKRGEIVRYGIDNDIAVMQGPFQLNQGGLGIAIRNPVYLHNDAGERYFWGLTIVIIKVPDIFNNSVNALSEFGYDYILSKMESPLTTEYKVIDSSKDELTDAVSYSFDLGGCTWKLDVEPTHGWKNAEGTHLIILCGIVVIILLELLTFSLLNIERKGKRFKMLSVTDGMTGLYNRIGFNEQVDKYLEDNDGKRKCIGILLDVDNFKFINDVYGHEVGDTVLRQLALSMKEMFGNNAIIGRNGGDEFCMILKDCDEYEARLQIELFTEKQRTFDYQGNSYKYSISLGYVEYPTYAKKVSELLRYADMALYEVKLRGKHGCLPYRPDYRDSNVKRSQLGFKLNDISDNIPGAFFIYKADRKDEQIVYANHEMIRLCGCATLDEFLDYTGAKFSNLVYPDDLEYVQTSIYSQINLKEGQVNDYVKYRLLTKDGSFKNVLDYGHLVDSENYGQLFYVLVVDYDFIQRNYDL